MKLWVGALLVGLLLWWSGDSFPDYRYRMTIEVATPAGPRRYATVRQVTMTDALMIAAPNAPGIDRKLAGEAVVMDLPGGATIFALLGAAGNDWPEDVALPHDRSLHGKDAWRARAQVTGAYELRRTREQGNGVSRANWPIMARFERANDPRSIVAVDPDALPGGGRVQRITIAMTRDPISTGIEARLPVGNLSGPIIVDGVRVIDSIGRGVFTTQPR